MTYPLHEYAPANAGRAVLCVGHANGFPPNMYAPLVAAISGAYRAVCLPARPWWGTAAPEDFHDWHMLADDFIGGIQQHQLAPVIGIGHSMSGVAMVMAAVKQPALFRALILLDPVFLPPWFAQFLRLKRFLGWQSNFHRLVQGALKRRREWTSFEDAYTRFRGRSLFDRCSDEMVRLYTEGMTRPNAKGGVDLAYPPEWEAKIFSAFSLDEWLYPPQLEVPCCIISGAESDTFLMPARRAWQRRRPDVVQVSLPETGHLLPFEQPALVARTISDFLATLSIK